jgi:hypothetical protein
MPMTHFIIALIVALSSIALMTFCIFGYPLMILRPITKLLRQPLNATTKGKFSLTDIFSLMFLGQLPFTLVRIIGADINSHGPQTRLVIYCGFLVVAGLVWYIGLKMLNHIGVTDQLKRVVCISYTIPAGIAGGILAAMWLGGLYDWFLYGPVTVAYIAGPIGLVAMTAITFYSSRWIASEVDGQELT